MRGILVTHEHGDHACGAFEFAAAHRVTVYLTHGTLAALKAEGKVIDGVPVQVVNGRQSFFVDGMQVLPFTVPHDAREPVQYVLSDGAAKLGVLTDVGKLDRARRADAFRPRRAGARVQLRPRHAVDRRAIRAGSRSASPARSATSTTSTPSACSARSTARA